MQSLQKSFPKTIKRNLSDPYREWSELYEESCRFFWRRQESTALANMDTMEMNAK
jgi:hypothetical protein